MSVSQLQTPWGVTIEGNRVDCRVMTEKNEDGQVVVYIADKVILDAVFFVELASDLVQFCGIEEELLTVVVTILSEDDPAKIETAVRERFGHLDFLEPTETIIAKAVVSPRLGSPRGGPKAAAKKATAPAMTVAQTAGALELELSLGMRKWKAWKPRNAQGVGDWKGAANPDLRVEWKDAPAHQGVNWSRPRLRAHGLVPLSMETPSILKSDQEEDMFRAELYVSPPCMPLSWLPNPDEYPCKDAYKARLTRFSAPF